MQQAKAKARHQRVVEIIEAIASKTSSWLFVIIYGSAMIVVGINVPKIVVCEHRGDFCYVTRFRAIKAALDDLTPPKMQNKIPDKKH